MKNPRDTFASCFQLKMRDNKNTLAILEQKCENSHQFSERIKSIGARIFNNTIYEERKRQPAPVAKDSSSSRKIKKLQSE